MVLSYVIRYNFSNMNSDTMRYSTDIRYEYGLNVRHISEYEYRSDIRWISEYEYG
jgi:hypothetical protein